MKQKILIVDDSSLARRMTRRYVEELGYEPDEAADGATALERYVVNRPDAVLLDMVMTGMYGLDVLIKLRELDPKAIVIVITAGIQKTTRDQVQGGGAVGIINKPVKKEELAQTLETAFNGGTTWS